MTTPTLPHVVVLHRWASPYAVYDRYLDHRAYAVTYVSTAEGVPSVPSAAAALVVVPDIEDEPDVAQRVKALTEEYGPPIAIVALKEDDLLAAARLRAEWDCPGPATAELVPFLDKLVMAETAAAAGVPAPAFAPAPDAAAVHGFAAEHGWPVIVKPRMGNCSEGVSKLDGPGDVARLPFDPDRPQLVQAFDPRSIYHVDGYFDGTHVSPFRAARYVNTCLGFRAGDVLGSVTEDDPALVEAIGAFTELSLRGLSADRPTVFHLELFVDRETGECGFLECGARVSGAEIPFLWREVYGHDLMDTAFTLAMGRRPEPAALPEGTDVAGYLLYPAPEERPCRVVEATPLLGRVECLYTEVLLGPGEVLPATGPYYEHVGGRFRFRGRTSAEVEAAIEAAAGLYRLRTEAAAPVDAD